MLQTFKLSIFRCDQRCNLALFQSGNPPRWIQKDFDCHMRYGYLDNVSTDQIAYATQASEGAFIVPYDERLAEVRLEILKENYEHSDARMYVAFKESDSSKLSSILSAPLPPQEKIFYDIFVEFEVKHSFFNSLIRAINKISSTVIKRLLPTRESFLQLHNISNDLIASLMPPTVIYRIDQQDQWKALYTILSFDQFSPPLLINGSFGTGKTQVLAVATYCLIRLGQEVPSTCSHSHLCTPPKLCRSLH